MTAEPRSALPLPRMLPLVAWLSFVANVVIIGTGGAVRLTGSGLGCPTWPLCTPDSLVPTAALSYHSLIEFGNRTMTGVLGILAILVLVLVWRARHERRDLFALAWIVLGGIVLQGVVGGVIVWLHLNANLVGFHYIASLVLVCLTAAFLVRMRTAPGPRESVVPKGFLILAHVTSLVLAVTVFVGVLTTGAGPHSGDDSVQRQGFDASLLAHIHSWPGYALLALTVVLVAWAAIRRLPPLAWTIALLAVQIVQVLVGVYQARNGLPPVAVGVHMVLASLTAAAMTTVILRLKLPVARSHAEHLAD